MSKIIVPAVLLVVGLVAGYVFGNSGVSLPVGSVTVGNEYSYFTTSTLAADRQIKTGPGALGSVVITGTGNGAFDLYDATTTNVSARAAGKTTSSRWLASFPASATAGTYVLDVTFTDGLLLDANGTVGTTSITYR